MKSRILYLLLTAVAICSCGDHPIDDNGLLISEKSACYMSSFNLVGTDNQPVLVTTPTVANALIDTVKCEINAVAKFGTNLKKVKPYCGLTEDMICEPGMGEWVDFSAPRKYTIVSGNRKIRKEYTVNVTIQQ
jgi:hypothetical protein